MKIYTGTDIIEIERVKNSIENIGKKFIEEIYTQKEIEYCESKKMQNINIMQPDLQQKKQYLKRYQNY